MAIYWFCKKITAEIDIKFATKNTVKMDMRFLVKIAAEVDMRFAIKTSAEKVVLGVGMYMKMTLIELDITVVLQVIIVESEIGCH